MRGDRPAELVVGSVQLGLTYGAANRTGKPSRETALRLVRHAAESGVTAFDTARAYGDAEERLGEALRGRKAVTTTKLSPLPELGPDAPRDAVRASVDRSVADSLTALKRNRLDCLMLHRWAHRTAFGGAVWERLKEFVASGVVSRLGVSVQSPAEALEALSDSAVQHLQLAFNIFDWRWGEAGVIAAITARKDVTVHARSVLLQGVLASSDPNVWPAVPGVDAPALISWLAGQAQEFGRDSVADLCLAYARGQDWIDGVVVGMETEDQLETNLRLMTRAPLGSADCKSLEAHRPHLPAQFLDPAQWPKR